MPQFFRLTPFLMDAPKTLKLQKTASKTVIWAPRLSGANTGGGEARAYLEVLLEQVGPPPYFEVAESKKPLHLL